MKFGETGVYYVDLTWIYVAAKQLFFSSCKPV